MNLKPCRHLDHTPGAHGPDITLETCAPHFPEVKFWRRGPTWTDNGPGQKRNPECVQFCGEGRGRINAIFDCYDGSMPCYDPVSDSPEE